MEAASLQEGAMRPKNSTLTARQVHRCAAAILQDHLKLPDHGPKCRAGPLLTLLFYAAARITSLSDACKCLARRPLRRGGPLGPDRHPARLRRVAAPAQRRLGRRPAPALAPPAAAPGRRPGPDPLPWPAAARPRRDLPLSGQERDQPLPRLRHALCHPPRLPLHRGLDGRQAAANRWRRSSSACSARPPRSASAAACCCWIAASTAWA